MRQLAAAFLPASLLAGDSNAQAQFLARGRARKARKFDQPASWLGEKAAASCRSPKLSVPIGLLLAGKEAHILHVLADLEVCSAGVIDQVAVEA